MSTTSTISPGRTLTSILRSTPDAAALADLRPFLASCSSSPCLGGLVLGFLQRGGSGGLLVPAAARLARHARRARLPHPRLRRERQRVSSSSAAKTNTSSSGTAAACCVLLENPSTSPQPVRRRDARVCGGGNGSGVCGEPLRPWRRVPAADSGPCGLIFDGGRGFGEGLSRSVGGLPAHQEWAFHPLPARPRQRRHRLRRDGGGPGRCGGNGGASRVRRHRLRRFRKHRRRRTPPARRRQGRRRVADTGGNGGRQTPPRRADRKRRRREI